MTNVSGFSAESITGLMVLAGFGMVVGNLVSGRLSDQYTPGKVGTTVQAMICVVLLLIFFLSPYPWLSALLMCLCTAGLFAVSSPEQVLIIRVAKVERCWERLVCKWHLTWEMPSCVCWWACYQWRLSLSGTGRSSFRHGRFYSVSDLLQEISGEILKHFDFFSYFCPQLLTKLDNYENFELRKNIIAMHLCCWFIVLRG